MSSRPAWIGAAVAVLALTGCESNIERSASIESARRKHAQALKASTISIAKPNPQVRVQSSTIVRGKEGDAVVVRLLSRSAQTMSDVPIEIVVKGSSGQALYRNNLPGVTGALVMVPLLPPHVSTTWVDDQVSATGNPKQVSVLVGTGHRFPGRLPQVQVRGAQQPAGGEEVSGRVMNSASVAQHELVVDAIATKAGRVVAAGRALLPEVGAGSASSFQLYMIGNPQGASLRLTTSPSTLP